MPDCRSIRPVPFAAAISTALAFVDVSTAQCGPQASSPVTIPDTDGSVEAMCWWDPDGAGPQPPVVVLGGTFRSAGDVVARGLALYDPATREFATLGSGIESVGYTIVSTITVTPQNELIVAGSFTSIDGVPATNVARWDGNNWQPMGAGIPYFVRAVLVRQNGDLIAGVSGNLNGSVFRWNGSAWQRLGTELFGSAIALHESPTGELFAGGNALVGPTDTLARWDGAHWSTIANAPDGFVAAILRHSNGDLIVAGGFPQAGGVTAYNIASWDGSSWSPLGGGVSDAVLALAERPNGELIAGGLLTAAGGQPANRVARWDGSGWSSMADGLGLPGEQLMRPVASLLTLPGGDLLAGGEFHSTGGDYDHLARWDGSTWQQARPGTGGAIWSSARALNGDLYVAGEFTRIEGVPARRVARRSNGTWLPLGSGADANAYAIAVMPNGEIVLGGAFTSVGGVSAVGVARWDGAAWHAMGAGLPGVVRSFAVTSTGELLASGEFLDHVAIWNGTSWSGTGVAGPVSPLTNVERLLQPTPGDILLANTISPTGARRWNGFGWQPLAASDPYRAPMQALRLQTLIRLPDGELLGGFPSVGTQAVGLVQRWNGSAWASVFAPGFGVVYDLKWSDDGGVLAAGRSGVAGGEQTGSLRELTTTCPATAVPVGSGCTGSGGPNVLTALERAWVGGTLRSRATGMPLGGLAIEVFGLGALSLPLASALPQAGAACTLLTTADFVRLQVPDQGTVELALTLPNDPSLVGATFRQQVAAIELDTLGAVVDATSSNALQFAIGSW